MIKRDPSFKVDNTTGDLVTMDIVHHEIHAGEMFNVSYKTADGAGLGDNASLHVLIKTPADKDVHFAFDVQAGGDAEIIFLEEPTISASGTGVTPLNMNRGSSRTAGASVALNATSTASGTILFNMLLPGGTGPQAGGGNIGIRPGTEWILKRNTSYLGRGINRAGTTQDFSFAMQWYEEE